MSAPAIPQSDQVERVVAAVRDAAKPVSFKGLGKLVKSKEEPLRAALESAVAAGQVHRWPDRRGSQYFWHVAPEEKAREAILSVAAAEALSKAALTKLAAKKLPGFPVKRLENVASALLAESHLQAVPGFSGSAKLLVRAGGQKAYFSTARAFLEKKIRSAGFDPAAFFSGSSAAHDKLTEPQTASAALLLEAVRALEPVKGVPVSTLRLRNHLPHLSKQEFDAAALQLRQEQKVSLSLHADAYNSPQEEKESLIDGQDGTYYVAIAIR
ncbi:MAG: hypothetical protein WBE37_24810 [Bryobacteraceae bacterium]